MNAAHLHLLVNHAPIFGIFFGAIVVLYGIIRRNIPVLTAGYIVLLIAVIGGAIAYISGDKAADIVWDVPGISKPMLHEHEQAALFALISACIVGVLSVVGLYFNAKRPDKSRTVAIIVFIVCLWAYAVALRTGWLGGKIRHSEIDNPPVTNVAGDNDKG